MFMRVSNLSFSYSDSVAIIGGADFQLGRGWTGIIGPNAAGKSTLLRLIAGELEPSSGSPHFDGCAGSVLLQQSVEWLTPEIECFADASDPGSFRLCGELGLDPTEIERWPTLSPGERKRWQVGAALWNDPAVLMLDEPTDHAAPFPPSGKKGDTSHLNALPVRRISRRVGVAESGVETECAGRIAVTHSGISVHTVRLRQLSGGIPLLYQYHFVPCHERVIPPLMIWGVLCEVVLTDTIVIVDFEYHQIIRSHALSITQRQWVAHHGRMINVAPHVDEGEPFALFQRTRHEVCG